jgi:hypothetical protein
MAEAIKLGLPVVGEQMAAPRSPDCCGFAGELQVNVIFTTWPGTRSALRTANQWARCLGARIVLWSPQIVPRQFSVTAPPVSTAFMEQRLHSLAVECCEDLDISIRVCLCRDLGRCVLNVLKPDSLVLVGGKKRWFSTQEQNLATLLHSYGHRVLFIPAKENVPATVAARIPT